MKTALLALASLAGLSVWYAELPIVGIGVTWVRNELGINQGTSAPTSSQKQEYVTAPVEEGEIRRIVTATGTLNAIVNVEIGSQVPGQIAKVFVDFNDEVKSGQPLAQLDQRTFEARVEEARAAADLADANISVAKVKVERARIDAQESEAQIAVFKARLDNARVSLDKTQAELRRKQVLVARRTASIIELEDATMNRASAQVSVREAEAIMAAHEHKVAGARTDVRRFESELESAVDNLAQKKALVQFAQTELDRTTIRSPIDGVIVGRKVSKGQTVATDFWFQSLFTVAGDLRQMQINAKVDEADISMLRVGQQAMFTVDGYPGREFTAAVQQIRKSPEVQDNVVTYTVVLSVNNDDSVLLPGMTALARITVNKTGPVLKVPLAALRFNPKRGQYALVLEQNEVTSGKPAVLWVVGKNGEPESLSVGLGEEDANDAAVVSRELAKGDLVIIGEAANSVPRSLFGIRLGL